MLLTTETWRLKLNVAEYREEFSGNVGQTEHTGVKYVMPLFLMTGPENVHVIHIFILREETVICSSYVMSCFIVTYN